MNDAIDKALKADLLTPPEDFTERVMIAVAARPLPAPASRQAPASRPAPGRILREAAEWLALAGAVFAGMAQLLPLLLGLWTFTNAG